MALPGTGFPLSKFFHLPLSIWKLHTTLVRKLMKFNYIVMERQGDTKLHLYIYH